jgi:serine/threonine-protein kinase
MVDGPSPIAAPADDAHEVCERFETAWRSGNVPGIDDFLPAGSHRREVLLDLVRIDLEQRWRQHGRAGGPAVPRLEEYRQRFPELADLPDELIGEEYLVRHWLGDRPRQDEYLTRFPDRADRLRELLARIDAELASEFAGSRHGASLSGSARRVETGPAQRENREVIPPVPLAVGAMVDELRRHGLLSPLQLAELDLDERQGKLPDPHALAELLKGRDWLTPFQADYLQHGRAPELIVGPYILQKPLGEGGAGQVFKAWHKAMNRPVALKVLRSNLLVDAEVVTRFYREIRIVGQLSHPNIVRAYDAGPIGERHCLVMEFIDGIDLAQLVRQGGPLPVERVCDCIRQTAQGLQHAHEHGLVHRDIKPSNLMVVGSEQWAVGGKEKEPAGSALPTARGPLPTIKILDLGLARLRKADVRTDVMVTEWMTSLVTPMGSVMMGTPDFMAPEQALDFHAADVRADIYSLGCTFYYLLTGQPPFPGGTLAQKLLRHQQATPPLLSQFRPEVPAALEAIVGRMLAKQPEARFQVPGEIVAALASGPNALRLPPSDPAIQIERGGSSSDLRAPPPWRETGWEELPVAPAIDRAAPAAESSTTLRLPSARPARPDRRKPALLAAALFVAIGLPLLLVAWVLTPSRSPSSKAAAQHSSRKSVAPTGPPADPSLLFFDDFSSGKLERWRLPALNPWKVVLDRESKHHVLTGGTIAPPGTDQTDRRTVIALHFGEPGWRDYAIEALVRFGAERSPDHRYYGVILLGRVQPNLDCYHLEYGVHADNPQTDLILFGPKLEAHAKAEGLPNVQKGRWTRLTLEMVGSTIRCKVDGVTLIEVSNSGLAGGSAALTLSNMSRAADPIDWKHIRVTELPRQSK